MTIVNTGSTLTVVNSFTLVGASTVDVGGLLDGVGTLAGSVSLLNQGVIAADGAGALIIQSATLNNQGTVLASVGTLVIASSASLTNLAASTLTGGVWSASGTGTIELLTGRITTDNATITLNGASAILESGTGTPQTIDNSLITVGTAGVLNLVGGRSFLAASSLVVNGTVTLDGGTVAAASGETLSVGAVGNIAGSGSLGGGSPISDGGKIEAKGGTLTLPAASSVSGGGTLQVDAGASLVLQAIGGSYGESIVNNGTIDAAYGNFFSGTLDMSGAYSGTGGFLVQGGPDSSDRTILQLPLALNAVNVAFDTNFGELLLDAGPSFNGTLTGFGNNETIVLTGVTNAAQATLSGNVLTLKNGGGGFVQSININAGSMDYSSAAFNIVENISSTQATLTVSGVMPATCFTAGTRIKTVMGEVPVERLKAGDVVHAHFAGTAPVVWLGHRHVNCRRHPDPSKIWPVRVSAHAFGPRMPERDLLLSPDHAVFVDDVLIPIKYLINGRTIAREQMDEVIYFHVELGEHDVLTAEGLPVKSYLENGDRAAFDNGGGVIALHPDFGARKWEAFGCAPVVVTGPILDAVIARTRARRPKSRPIERAIRSVA